ncbi:hypothetical protein [Massilioclostridium coli]|uniref:hypothetical protein n=1 Tax=Massilioclostridium coli TaxID=1870991 RepID=UPI0022E4456C|nr:hypothetical protein [Massilioclostridium coli]
MRKSLLNLEPLIDRDEQLASFAMLLADAMESEGADTDVYIPATRLLADLFQKNNENLKELYRTISLEERQEVVA